MNGEDYWILDRVSDGEAVLEGENDMFQRIPATDLPCIVQGGLYRKTPEGWEFDEQATQARREYMAKLTKTFFRRNTKDTN